MGWLDEVYLLDDRDVVQNGCSASLNIHCVEIEVFGRRASENVSQGPRHKIHEQLSIFSNSETFGTLDCARHSYYYNVPFRLNHVGLFRYIKTI